MTTAVKTRPTRKSKLGTFETVVVLPIAIVPTPVATKISQLITLLQRDGGASIVELTTTLGWLPHTTRAALTGLRKKGRDIIKWRAGDETRYSIAPTGGEA